MKKAICSFFSLVTILLLTFPASAQSAEKELTLMVYMCGSNLESLNGCASRDRVEMQGAGLNTDAVNLVLLTGGANTGGWARTRYSRLTGEQFRLDKNASMGANMGDPDTLSSFISYSIENYPAKKYALILWDHGEGPVGHLCHDECHDNDGLSLAELSQALEDARLKEKLSWIGFDACLMSTAEVALAVSPYAEYMIASEETEPSTGWAYDLFLEGIESDPDGAATGKRIIGAYFEANEGTRGLTLSCLDLSKLPALSDAMDEIYAPLSKQLNADFFSTLSGLRKAVTYFGEVVRSTDNGYDLVDLKSLTDQISSFTNADRVEKALGDTIVENRRTPDLEGASGLSVYHPYYNKDAYRESRRDDYRALPFCEGYQRYIQAFGSMLLGDAMADWSEIFLTDNGVTAALQHLFSLQMSEEQRQNYASAQLMILGAIGSASDTGIYESQLSIDADRQVECYYPVWVGDVSNTPEGLLSAAYASRSLYLTDENGTPLAGPIGYRLSDDGSQIYIFAQYQDNSGREGAVPTARVLYTFTSDAETGELTLLDTAVYDSVTRSYTRRLSFDEKEYTDLYIDRLARCVPESDGALPAFAEWINVRDSIELALPLTWQLRFFDAQLSGTQLYATMQITDTQQNSYCTPLIPVENPNLYDIDISPRSVSGDGFEMNVYAVMDNSPLKSGLTLGMESISGFFDVSSVVINGTRDVTNAIEAFRLSVYNSSPKYMAFHFGEDALTGLESIDTITLLGSRGTSRELTLHLQDCRLEHPHVLPAVPACELREGDVTWQIFEPRINVQGNVEAILRVQNDSDTNIDRQYNIAVNGRIQTNEVFRVAARAHTDACQRVVISNRAFISDFAVNGADSSVQLEAVHLMQRSGIRQVESLKLMSLDDQDTAPIEFRLRQPLPISAAEDAVPVSDFDCLMLDGDIRINAERILVGSDAAGILLTLQNTLDRDVFLAVKHLAVNSKVYYDVYEHVNYGSSDLIKLGAGCTAAMCVKIKAAGGVQEISDLALAFRYDDFTTRWAVINLNESAALRTQGGVSLDGDDFSVETASRKPGMIPADSTLSAADSSVTLSMALKNSSNASQVPIDVSDKLGSICADFRVENNSAKRLSYTFENYVINDRRCISGSNETGVLEPGEDSLQTCILGWDYSLDSKSDGWYQLTGIDEIYSLSCDLRVKQFDASGTEDETVFPLRWTFSDFSLTGIKPVSDALGQVRDGDVQWRLLSITAEEDSRLAEYGQLTLLFAVGNDTDEVYTCQADTPIIEGIMCSSHEETIQVAPHREGLLKLSFANRAESDYFDRVIYSLWDRYYGSLLQSSGYDTVQNIDLLLKREGQTAYTRYALALDKAWVLPEADRAERENLLEQQVLVSGNVTVGISYLAVGDDALSLTLSMRNDSEQVQTVSLRSPSLGDCAIGVGTGSSELLPHTVRVENFSVMLPENAGMIGLSDPLRFSLRIGEQLYENIALRTDVPLLSGSGFVAGSREIRLVSEVGEADFSMEDFSFELGFVPCKKGSIFDEESFSYNEVADFPRFLAGTNYLEDLYPGEYYQPALRIWNLSGEDAEIAVRAQIDGEPFYWDRVFIAAGDSFVAYAKVFDPFFPQRPDSYDCSFFINGTNVSSDRIEISRKKGFLDFDSVSVGDVVLLGSYASKNSPNTQKAPIDWVVVRVQDGVAYAVSRHILDLSDEGVLNSHMTLDKFWQAIDVFLNGSFFDRAFSPAEELRILTDPDDANGARVFCDDYCLLDNDAIGIVPSIRIDLNCGFLRLGHFEQDGNIQNGPEPIEWIILDKQDDRYLLVSRDGLSVRPLGHEGAEYHWESCGLRAWLNQSFYDTAFDESEKSRILTTELGNSAGGNDTISTITGSFMPTLLDRKNAGGENTTQDKVFLLSFEEADSCFPTDADRICYSSAGLGGKPCTWFLRSSQYHDRSICAINTDGSHGNVDFNSSESQGFYVRPAMWITDK